ncbi:MFS transporter [Actinomadura roseirufa]|uniref:MFS transporter n=1 Tax=Actinomadura roseirufa TaxID=2094049 RepID=UPI0010417286|nr:MFS transporter [Actinomadura roseirufa]
MFAPRPPRALAAACFLSNLDRFAVGPLLVAIAATTHTRLGAATMVASGHAVAYGLGQPVWGVLSDRLGRVRVMTVALLAAGAAGLASAFAPTLAAIVVLRTLTGAFAGAIVPTSLTYLGDTVPVERRQRALSDLMAAMGLATALATLFGGVVAHLVGWRVVFAVPATCALLVALVLHRLPEPPREVVPIRPWEVLRERWALVVMALGFLEGGLLLGGMTFVAPALQDEGAGEALAGAVAASYGIGVMALTQVVKPASTRLPAWTLAAIGGALMTTGLSLVALDRRAVTVAIAGVLLGGGWAFLHSTLQTWATTVAPRARGTGVALFVTALFVGSAAGSTAGAPLAQDGRFGALFAVAAALAVPLTVAAALARRRYRPPG